MIAAERPARPPPAARIADLSRDVLLSAAACVPAGDSRATERLLYHGNWLPLTPAWLERFPGEAAVRDFVVGDAQTLLSPRIRVQDRHWVHWHGPQFGKPAPGFKVYVSVLPDHLPDAFRRTAEILAQYPDSSLKLSRTPRALVRPDRLVIHCGARTAVASLAGLLTDALDDLPAQGVPFTASPHGAAVSWARDPPARIAASWRRWVARKLAGYLHASDSASADGRAAFALERLRADGVETRDWAPAAGLWSEH